MTYCASVPQAAQAVRPAPAWIRHIHILLPDGTPPSGAQVIADLFEAANELSPDAPYRITTGTLADMAPGESSDWSRRVVVFLGGMRQRWRLQPGQRARTQKILRLSSRTVFVGGAVFLLCETGLQSVHSVAIHPNFRAAASEEGLSEETPGSHSAVSGPVHSATTSFAALRPLLEIIAEDHGAFTADAVESYLGLKPESEKPESRVSLDLLQKAQGDRLIGQTLALMRSHIEDPLSISALSSKLGVSTRKLQRRFLDHTGKTPLAAYRALRIERAHQLLTLTDLPVSEIVVAAGFGTYPNLARWTREEFGECPRTLRRRAFRGADLQPARQAG